MLAAVYQASATAGRAGNARPTEARPVSALSLVIETMAWKAASGVAHCLEIPKPEPAVKCFEPPAPAGMGTTPSLNLARSPLLIAVHGPSTYIAAEPPVNWPCMVT